MQNPNYLCTVDGHEIYRNRSLDQNNRKTRTISTKPHLVVFSLLIEHLLPSIQSLNTKIWTEVSVSVLFLLLANISKSSSRNQTWIKFKGIRPGKKIHSNRRKLSRELIWTRPKVYPFLRFMDNQK